MAGTPTRGGATGGTGQPRLGMVAGGGVVVESTSLQSIADAELEAALQRGESLKLEEILAQAEREGS